MDQVEEGTQVKREENHTDDCEYLCLRVSLAMDGDGSERRTSCSC